MARLSADQMGVHRHQWQIVAYREGNPPPTAAAVVRDLVNIVASRY
jgi:hypothetical protein